MPKERIKHGRIMIRDAQRSKDIGGITVPGAVLEYEHDGETPIPETATTSVMPSLDLYWNRDYGEVQLSFVAEKRWFIDALEEPMTSEQVDPATQISIYSESLSRSELNHFIRTLRRARDAAFGADA